MIRTARCIRIYLCPIVLALCAWSGQANAHDFSPQMPPLPASSATLQRIAFGSCAKHWQHQRIWEAEKQLRKPAEIRLIASSVQIIPNEKGMDEWGCFPHERDRLFDLIRASKANGVILLSGNVHFAEVSTLETTTYPLLDFTSSGLTHVNEAYATAANEFRIAGPFAEMNFGLVEVDWTTKPVQIRLEAIAEDGTTGFEHLVSLDALR